MPWASSFSWLLDRSAREWWRHPSTKEPRDEHQDHRHRHLSHRTAAIHIKVARLRQLADNHFGHNLDAIHWGHVGDLGRVDQALDDLLAIFDDQAK